jgi:MFS family permease
MLSKRIENLRQVYNDFPRQFWVLVGARFIDQVGGYMVFPFLTLYITEKFGVGMTEVGAVFGLVALTSVIGNILGGALTDRFGRKKLVIYGLIVSALLNVVIGFANAMWQIYFLAAFFGFLGNLAGPAHGAMVADMLPEEKRAQGYGIMRVTFNLAVVIGPAIGGILATTSYLLLFIGDAISSTITAAIVAVAIQETKPEKAEGEPEETMAQSMGGYLDVVRDVAFVLFVLASMLLSFVYMQLNTTLGVYLRDTHGIIEQYFGYMLSLNALMVVLFQFPITRRIARYKPMLMMALGTLLYAIGFGMYGFVSTLPLFVAAVAILTIGEMIVAPNAQALVAKFAPEHMRGRYMAFSGFSGVIPMMFGPLLSGAILDNADPRMLWYIVGVVGLVAAAAFVGLDRRVDQPEDETGHVAETAEQAPATA